VASPDKLPSYSIAELFPLNVGGLAHRVARSRVISPQPGQPVPSAEEVEEVLPKVLNEKQPEIGGDLVEAVTVDPGQLLTDLRDAYSSFSSMSDPL